MSTTVVTRRQELSAELTEFLKAQKLVKYAAGFAKLGVRHKAQLKDEEICNDDTLSEVLSYAMQHTPCVMQHRQLATWQR